MSSPNSIKPTITFLLDWPPWNYETFSYMLQPPCYTGKFLRNIFLGLHKYFVIDACLFKLSSDEAPPKSAPFTNDPPWKCRMDLVMDELQDARLDHVFVFGSRPGP